MPPEPNIVESSSPRKETPSRSDGPSSTTSNGASPKEGTSPEVKKGELPSKSKVGPSDTGKANQSEEKLQSERLNGKASESPRSPAPKESNVEHEAEGADTSKDVAKLSPDQNPNTKAETSPRSILRKSTNDRRRGRKSRESDSDGVVKIRFSPSEVTCISPFIHGRQKFVKPPLPLRRKLIEVAQDLTHVMRQKEGTLSSSGPKKERSFLERWTVSEKQERQKKYSEKLEEIEHRMRKIEIDLSKDPQPKQRPLKFPTPKIRGRMRPFGPKFSQPTFHRSSARPTLSKGSLRYPSLGPMKGIPRFPFRGKYFRDMRMILSPRSSDRRHHDDEEDDDRDDDDYFDIDEDSDSESPPL